MSLFPRLTAREVLIKSGSMRLQWKINEFKAKIARHSTAMAQIFNAEIVYFTCSIADHGLISASLGRPSGVFSVLVSVCRAKKAVTEFIEREVSEWFFRGIREEHCIQKLLRNYWRSSGRLSNRELLAYADRWMGMKRVSWRWNERPPDGKCHNGKPRSLHYS